MCGMTGGACSIPSESTAKICEVEYPVLKWRFLDVVDARNTGYVLQTIAHMNFPCVKIKVICVQNIIARKADHLIL